jgi:hypothetical protein
VGRSESQLPPTDRAPALDEDGRRTFTDRGLSGRILIDNASFKHCQFQHALLIYAGGIPPVIQECSFEDVGIEFHGPAGRTLVFLQAMATPASGMRDIVKASFARIFGH